MSASIIPSLLTSTDYEDPNDNFFSFKITYTNNTYSNTGIPFSLYARQTIERCKAVEKANRDFWDVKMPREKPNSSHTIIASDKTQNCVYEFYGDGNYTTKDTIE
ncbi:MAG: hypothetical protein VX777_07075 [Chlamydiota bacterium]|nr:hypothetical protein [Chlamydiota bacterium]